ncbi:MAG: hypothetical protein GY764_01915, partial [Halieaceae bacterium]|nr:hypothetical protein [Halieaceae bacterium]
DSNDGANGGGFVQEVDGEIEFGSDEDGPRINIAEATASTAGDATIQTSQLTDLRVNAMRVADGGSLTGDLRQTLNDYVLLYQSNDAEAEAGLGDASVSGAQTGMHYLNNVNVAGSLGDSGGEVLQEALGYVEQYFLNDADAGTVTGMASVDIAQSVTQGLNVITAGATSSGDFSQVTHGLVRQDSSNRAWADTTTGDATITGSQSVTNQVNVIQR